MTKRRNVIVHIATSHRHVLLDLQSTERFDDGLVQLRYSVSERPKHI